MTPGTAGLRVLDLPAASRASVDEFEHLEESQPPRDRLRPQPIHTFTLGAALEDSTLLEPPAAVVPPFLFGGRVTLLSGREKSGKSTLLANAAAALSRGATFLGTELEARRVLWISLDESIGDTVRRFHALGADPERLVLSIDTPNAATLEPVLRDGDFSLVCIDTLNELLLGRSMNRSEEVLPVLRPIVEVIRDSGAAGCIIAHAGKSSGQYLGSVTIGGLVDAPLSLKRVITSNAVSLDPGAEIDEEEAADDGRRILTGPTRWGGKLRMRLSFDGARYSVGDAPIPLPLRVLQELAVGEASATSLAERLAVRKERMLEVTRELQAGGYVKRAKVGFAITDMGLLKMRTPTTPELAREPVSERGGPSGPTPEPPPGPDGNRSGSDRFPNGIPKGVNPGTGPDHGITEDFTA